MAAEIVDLDPALSLAFTLRANPGAYALLLGSGISSEVVPSGWDILTDLVKKIAAAAGATDEDPLAWYGRERGSPPRYDDVLAALTSTPEEGVGLLRPYFEPEGESEQKGPTDAHRAIARLISEGLIRVVLTTNFDRLLERALEEIGITPTVLATPTAVEGARPLHQQQACIIKLHGDYLDPLFLNTGQELASYARAVDDVLDQVLDEYGLIIVGWSATWDTALRAAIERCKSHRYGCMWVEPFPLSEAARRLVELRRAQVVVGTADVFFARLLENVGVLSEFDRPHPVSVAVAVARAKRFIEQNEEIRLHDLLAEEFERARRAVGEWPLNETSLDALRQVVERIDSAMDTISCLVATCARWGDSATDAMWVPRLIEWATQPGAGGTSGALDLRYYPATRVMYAAGVAMMAAGRVLDLEALLRRAVTNTQSAQPAPISSELSVVRTLGFIQNPQHRQNESSAHVFDQLKSEFVEHLRMSEAEFATSYEYFEYLQFLIAADYAAQAAGPSGPYIYRAPGLLRFTGFFGGARSLASEELGREAGSGPHPWIRAGLFDGDEERLRVAAAQFDAWVAGLNPFRPLS